MFGSQSLRLLRDKWSSAKDLAMELYAMFQDGNPVETGGGLTVSSPAGVPPLVLLPTSYGPEPAISFGGKPGDPAINFNPASSPGMTFNGPSFTFQYTNPDGSPGETSLGGKNPTATPSSTVPGVVVSGTGSNYTVTIYPKGLGGPTKTVSVTQLSIDPKATIPAGTWAAISATGSGKKVSYFMQVPVWGNDPS